MVLPTVSIAKYNKIEAAVAVALAEASN